MGLGRSGKRLWEVKWFADSPKLHKRINQRRGLRIHGEVLTIPCHPILLAFLNLPEPRESVTELSILLQFWTFLSVILWGGTTFCPSHLTQPLPTFSFSECLAPFSSRKSPPLSLLALLLPMVFASLLMFPFGFCPLLGVPWFRKVPDLVPWFSNTYLPTI